MELQEELKQQAISLGLCKQWQEEWGNPNIAELCHKYIRGLDFCIKHDYPKLEYLEKHFKGKTEQYGIYISDNAIADNQQNVIANGASKILVRTNMVSDVTARHTSEIHIEALDRAFVYVSMHDDCKLIIDRKDPRAKICVSYWSGTIVNPELIDRIHDKNKQPQKK